MGMDKISRTGGFLDLIEGEKARHITRTGFLPEEQSVRFCAGTAGFP